MVRLDSRGVFFFSLNKTCVGDYVGRCDVLQAICVVLGNRKWKEFLGNTPKKPFKKYGSDPASY